jgi:hypothetical protein
MCVKWYNGYWKLEIGSPKPTQQPGSIFVAGNRQQASVVKIVDSVCFLKKGYKSVKTRPFSNSNLLLKYHEYSIGCNPQKFHK